MSVSDGQNRPEKPRNKLPWYLGGAAVVIVAVTAGALILPGLFNGQGTAEPAAAGDADEERVSVKLGVVDEGNTSWDVFVEKAAEEGIDVEIVGFTDYTTPNPALASGDIDINKFQHTRYLAQHNVATGDELQPLGSSEIYPIGFYSKEWASVEEVPDGAEVTLSNNPANQVRPLLALYNAGLVGFTKDADWTVTLDDVDYDNSVIGKITPIDPTQTAASLDSVDIAFVDSNFAQNAGLTDEQKIYEEDADRDDLAQYINIFAVRPGDETNEDYLKLIDIYHSPEVEAAIEEENGGVFEGIFKEVSVDDLKDVLATQEAEFK